MDKRTEEVKDISYKTVSGISEGFYKEKGSKFLAFAIPIKDEAQAKLELEHLRKKFHDARHHCYAFILNKNGNPYERANDDGEPNHSAGDPILGQIRSFELSNTMVVVVRYFGGTKLGVSGLINAYKTAAEESLKSAITQVITLKKAFEIIFPYEKTNEVQRLVNEFKVDILDQQFFENCKLVGELIPSMIESFKEKMSLVDHVKLTVL